jgi:hypothetical protein
MTSTLAMQNRLIGPHEQLHPDPPTSGWWFGPAKKSELIKGSIARSHQKDSQKHARSVLPSPRRRRDRLSCTTTSTSYCTLLYQFHRGIGTKGGDPPAGPRRPRRSRQRSSGAPLAPCMHPLPMNSTSTATSLTASLQNRKSFFIIKQVFGKNLQLIISIVLKTQDTTIKSCNIIKPG